MDQLVRQLMADLARIDAEITLLYSEGYGVDVNKLLDQRLEIQAALDNVGRIILARS